MLGASALGRPRGMVWGGRREVALVVKNLFDNAGGVRDMGSIPGLERCPGGGHGQPTPIFLPGESHGQRSLVDHGP